MLLVVALVLFSGRAWSAPARARLSDDVRALVQARRPARSASSSRPRCGSARRCRASRPPGPAGTARCARCSWEVAEQIERPGARPGVETVSTDQSYQGLMATTVAATGSDQVWAGLRGRGRHGPQRGHRRHRLRHHAASRPARRVVASVDFVEPRTLAASTSTVTARTWPASSPGTAAVEGFAASRPGRTHQPPRDGRPGPRVHERRHRRDRLGHRAPRLVRHPDPQPVARPRRRRSPTRTTRCAARSIAPPPPVSSSSRQRATLGRPPMDGPWSVGSPRRRTRRQRSPWAPPTRRARRPVRTT